MNLEVELFKGARSVKAWKRRLPLKRINGRWLLFKGEDGRDVGIRVTLERV